MSSLDEVHEQMRLFDQALREFNSELRASSITLSLAHEQTTSLWKDAAAVRYVQAYEPLRQSLDEYLKGAAPRFEQFLQAKVSQLEQYLNGM
ncbi:MAG TPA: hypothetical protein VGM84_24645 [Steroidobacteraceae bacterium]|jgi:hypothetical protein